MGGGHWFWAAFLLFSQINYNYVPQARMQDFHKKGSYLRKTGPKPKGGLIGLFYGLFFYYTLWGFWPKGWGISDPETPSGYGPV